MTDADKLQTFHSQLESDITEMACDHADTGLADFRENILTQILSDELSAAGVLESPEVCHYEGGRASGTVKVNGYGIPDEDSRLDVFITLYVGPSDHVSTVNATDVDAAFRKLERFVGKARDALHHELDPASDMFLMSEHIHRMREQIDRVCFYFFTNALLVQRKEKERKSDVFGLQATYEVWDLERLRRLRESGTSYEALNVDFRNQPAGGLPCVVLGADMAAFQTSVTLFPGKLLADLYDEHGARLLELNVRSYLQARRKVNAGILKTLRECPEDFMAYNNGITVVAEEIVFGDLSDGSRGILELRGMQIVNGGQTTASIHRAAKDFQADLSRVFVQGKVTVVSPERFQEVVPLISRFSNSQNKVTESDLSANHAFHVGVERVSRREWTPDQKSMWFYERARGSYQTAKVQEGTTPALKRRFEERYPSRQRFNKEDLARFENAWQGLPHIVSHGGQKNFVHYMQKLGAYEEGWEPTREMYHHFVAKGILFREVQRAVRIDPTITAYQINVVAYTAALVADKTARRINLDAIWQMQKLSDALSELIASWAPVIFQHLPDIANREGRHIGESFKRLACWEHIRSLDLRVSRSLEAELVDITGLQEGETPLRRDGRPLTPGDQNNIARCVELDEKQWLAIAEWGQQSEELANWQRGIARTLAGYAAEGWTKLPSQKQAKHGTKIIETARSAQVDVS